MIEIKYSKISKNVLFLASFVSILAIAGCGSGGSGSQTEPVALETQATSPATTDTTTNTTPNTTGTTSYKFVDDSFATQAAPTKPAWEATDTEVVEAKNFGDGSLTGDTIKAAIEAI